MKPRSLLRLASAALCLFVVGLASAAPSSAATPRALFAATPRAFFGVDPVSVPTDAQFGVIARGGVGSIRFPLSWGALQPTAGGPISWSQFDQLVGRASRFGIEILPDFYGMPEQLGSSSTLPVATVAQRQGWSTFLQAAVQRYGPNGRFWSEHGAGSSNPVPYAPIGTWQIWNEENYFYFTSHPSPRRYAQLLKISSQAIRSLDGRARLILGGMFGRPNKNKVGGQAIFATRFLDGLYRVKGIKGTFDGVSLHPYARNTRRMVREIRDLRAVMNDHRDGRTGFYMSEVGWGSGGDSVLDKGPAGQATELTNAFRALIGHRKQWKIQRVYWYSLSDELPNQGCIFCDSTGLFTNSFQPKPSWPAFAAVAGGQP